MNEIKTVVNGLDDNKLSLSGGIMTGALTLKSGLVEESFTEGGLSANGSNIAGVNSIFFNSPASNASQGIQFSRSGSTIDALWSSGGSLWFTQGRTRGSINSGTKQAVLHSGNTDNESIKYDTTDNKVKVTGQIPKNKTNTYYDWVGTTQQYKTAWDNGDISETDICYITDDAMAMSGDVVPIGALIPTILENAPDNYLLCNGQEVSQSRYPELYAICGTTFGSAESGYFKLPDLRGRVLAGYDSTQPEFNTIGALFGEKEHTLTVDELATHSHTINSQASADNGTSGWEGSPTSGVLRAKNASYTHNSEGNDTGDSQPHNNIQPTFTGNWMVKASIGASVGAKVVNSLESTETSDALSANMGRELSNCLNNYIDNGKIISQNWPEINRWQKMCYYDFEARFQAGELKITITNGGYQPGLLEFYVSVYNQGHPDTSSPIIRGYSLTKKGAFDVDNNVAIVDEGWSGTYRRVGVYVKQLRSYSILRIIDRYILGFIPTMDIVDDLPNGDVTYINTVI